MYFDKYLCDLCNRTFTAKKNLQRHTRCHCPLRSDKEKLYCPGCNYETARKYDMNKHMKTHFVYNSKFDNRIV